MLDDRIKLLKIRFDRQKKKTLNLLKKLNKEIQTIVNNNIDLTILSNNILIWQQKSTNKFK